MQIKLMTSASGNQSVSLVTPEADVIVMIEGDPIVLEEILPVAPEHIETVMELAKTNSIDSGTIASDISDLLKTDDIQNQPDSESNLT